VGATTVNNIVKYDVTTDTWSALTDSETLVAGVNGTVNSIFCYASTVFVAGTFTMAGGKPISSLAQWDDFNQKWEAINDNDTDLSVSNVNCFYYGEGYTPTLYVGGDFTSAGGKPANRIARWDYETKLWRPLIDSSTGVNGVNGPVYSITELEGHIFIGGKFTQAGGNIVNNLVKYDSSTSEFLSIGNGVYNSLVTATVYTMYPNLVGGNFSILIGGMFDKTTDDGDEITINNTTKLTLRLTSLTT
jgi:hypothetical protein